MIKNVSDDSIYRIVSIDPGTKTAGFAVVDVDIAKRTYLVKMVKTLKGAHALLGKKPLLEYHSARFLRNIWFFARFTEILEEYDPYTVAAEAPFFGRLPAVFGALIEQRSFFLAALYNWDRGHPYYLYSPSEVKKAVGVKGKSNDKEDMRKALAKRNDVLYDSGVSLDDMDEHEIDAVCVAIKHACTLDIWC